MHCNYSLNIILTGHKLIRCKNKWRDWRGHETPCSKKSERKDWREKTFRLPLLWKKKYKSKAYIGAQKHLLECSKKNKGQLKLKSFFKC